MAYLREFIMPIRSALLDGRIWINANEVYDPRQFRSQVENTFRQLTTLNSIKTIATKLLDQYPALNAIELTKAGEGEVFYRDWP